MPVASAAAGSVASALPSPASFRYRESCAANSAAIQKTEDRRPTVRRAPTLASDAETRCLRPPVGHESTSEEGGSRSGLAAVGC